jgi:hypothetical protein
METLQSKALLSEDNEHLQSKSYLTSVKEHLNKSLSSEDDEPLKGEALPDKIYKIVPHRKPKKIITAEDKLEQRKRNCINFLNKVNGDVPIKLTIEEIKQRNRQTNDNFRKLHKTAYNAYMNALMKERYKNDEAYRLREKERGKLRVLKRREAKLLNFNPELKPFYFNILSVNDTLKIPIFLNVPHELFKKYNMECCQWTATNKIYHYILTPLITDTSILSDLIEEQFNNL